MATSTMLQSSPLGSSPGSPSSWFCAPRQQTFQPKADWRASFTDSNRESFGGLQTQTKPLILRHQNGVWCPNLSDTNKPSSQPQPEVQSPPPKLSPSKSRLSLGRVPKTLRCHACQANIREQFFQDHLFFGVVRCDLCNLVCGGCRAFQQARADAEKGRSSCQHIFFYSEDPFEYLLPRLSGSDDMDVGGSMTLPNKLRVLQNYVNQLTSLHLREPWCNAVRKCKSRLIKAHTTPLEPVEDLELNRCSPTTGESACVEDSQGSLVSLMESNGLDNSLMAMPDRFTCSSPVQRDSQEQGTDNSVLLGTDDSVMLGTDDGVLLTQSYDLEHLEQAVEYVGLEEHLGFGVAQDQGDQHTKNKKRRKQDPYKKLKAHRLPISHRRRPHPMNSTDDADEAEDEDSLVKEDVALPEDGYYLMVREAVEECPMCYESLSPSHCSVNLRTFLFTATCSECGLLIYIVPDLPDGLKIVTDNGGGGVVMTETNPNKDRETSRKIQPRDFFAK
ncbi:hypothetical protein GWK47_005791 [Chionoecetes opilio]|uniref:Uncharacterized protein n=1 Tax=Chionoecetes opilio TaxID=41210 RepID=A0A8J5CYJ6_CHIOP|nr:hypothetical protein GWK47_005791 [Chionoecetes opilio]